MPAIQHKPSPIIHRKFPEETEAEAIAALEENKHKQRRMDNNEALSQWKRYVGLQRPMLIRRPPASWGVNGLILVPEESQNFVISDGDEASLLTFCKHQGLPVRKEATL